MEALQALKSVDWRYVYFSAMTFKAHPIEKKQKKKKRRAYDNVAGNFMETSSPSEIRT
ncbi:Hypothetical protein CINCED_3A009621 [Cinara cedri]|uniref:Uncharacterized protein n=1 Tax=Cinara cedri TaxID=506608 RepID=A0A5E4N4F9_9HEMI|nr:Hypothetical protein CINCED_3A009621 [Cinara cedri]